MMPVMDGYQALVGIRNVEKEYNIAEEKLVKVIMTTALTDEENVKMAFSLGCSVYSGKPIDKEQFEQALKKLGLIEGGRSKAALQKINGTERNHEKITCIFKRLQKRVGDRPSF
jgi:CheY-like chemotaxis protein